MPKSKLNIIIFWKRGRFDFAIVGTTTTTTGARFSPLASRRTVSEEAGVDGAAA
jgi:hypothetical protein